MTDDALQRSRERYCAYSSFEDAYAVRTQVERLRAVDGRDPWQGARRTADAPFLVIALWRLRMAAEMCEQLRPGSVAGALEAFDSALPGLRDLRNVLMHYDSYVMGNERRRTRAAESEEFVSLRQLRALFSSPDGFAWLDHEYRYEVVEAESTALYRAIAEVVGPPGEELSPT
ncbi:hypothetical protein [Demequina muriae]|uniref:Uncharacterized protein n=1 Tax=Demequina muriae TaxID=3051664 RepID=A0ABT8GDF2_9MICO|nr:hypothetical protein [Demequina sp. EGI L300058]MDN4479458.1 hypothetical protein [Demequina sp. EGI L300058]